MGDRKDFKGSTKLNREPVKMKKMDEDGSGRDDEEWMVVGRQGKSWSSRDEEGQMHGWRFRNPQREVRPNRI